MKFLAHLLLAACLLVFTAHSDARILRGSASPSTTFALAANRADVPTALTSIAANTTCRREHFAHPDGALTSIQTVDVGWYATGAAPANSDARTIKRYIEYPANTFTQITWSSGSFSVTIAPGTVVKSDIILLAIPAGAEFWERTVNLTATVTNFPIMQLPAAPTVIGVDDGCSATDQGNSGTIAASSSNSGWFGAAAIMGSIQTANARSFAIVGDSIGFGTGDGGIGAKGSSGYPARSLDVHGYPYTRLVASGWTAQSLAANTTLPAALYAAISFTGAIVELGVNDLANASRTQAQLLADQQTIYGLFSGKTIFQSTITTISTSTDGWATTANQTISSVGTMSLLNSVNTAIRAVPANVNVVLEAADAQMSARNSDIWAAPPAHTGDGTHPNASGASSIASTISGSI